MAHDACTKGSASMANQTCPKCDARHVTLLEFRYLPDSLAPVKIWTCLNRFCMHRWPL